MAGQIEAVREFNRFYTRRIGVLDEGLLRSPYSITEVRVLYEIARRDAPSASEIVDALGIDAGYLSRILGAMRRRGLVTKRAATDDARRALLGLTARGKKTFAALDARSGDEVRKMLRGIAPRERGRVVAAMKEIRGALAGTSPGTEVTLRHPKAGELGWIVHRHGVIYAEEYGWDARFEAAVARIVADFVERRDAQRERAWIAERDGEIVGSIFVVRASDTVAKLRLLLVEPEARGTGLGTRLVEECVRFARRAGYRKIVLWTNDVLVDARRIYERAGFRLVAEERHRRFGPALVGQTWARSLARR